MWNSWNRLKTLRFDELSTFLTEENAWPVEICPFACSFLCQGGLWRKKLQGRQDSPDLQMQHKWTPTLPHIYDLQQSQKLFQDLYCMSKFPAHFNLFCLYCKSLNIGDLFKEQLVRCHEIIPSSIECAWALERWNQIDLYCMNRTQFCHFENFNSIYWFRFPPWKAEWSLNCSEFPPVAPVAPTQNSV